MKNLFKFAAMMAAVVSVSSFVSCDEEDENNSFKSETFTVELIERIYNPNLYTGYTSIFEWEWTNSSEAAADSIDMVPNYNNLPIDSLQLIPYVDSMPKNLEYNMYDTIKEVWTFKTKEVGMRELKFRKLHIYSGPIVIEEDINELRRRAKEDPSAVVADTVVKF